MVTGEYECALCRVQLTPMPSVHRTQGYLHCPRCGLWCAAPYLSTAIKAGAVRPRLARRDEPAYAAASAAAVRPNQIR